MDKFRRFNEKQTQADRIRNKWIKLFPKPQPIWRAEFGPGYKSIHTTKYAVKYRNFKRLRFRINTKLKKLRAKLYKLNW